MSITQRIAKRLPELPPVIELDVEQGRGPRPLADRVREHVDGLDGVLHSIGFAPEAALGGNFLNTAWDDVVHRACTSRRTRSSRSPSPPAR